jgi:hypothetical protein
MNERYGNPSLPEDSSENLLYRNPLHVPAPANLRQARSKKASNANWQTAGAARYSPAPA